MPEADRQRFGPYVILDRIGDGGMAEIFLAKRRGYSGFEKLVALKKIHPKYVRNPSFAQMLIHEAKLAAALNHFNVVQVHDLGEIDRQVYIAMEYVRGRDLAAVLSNTYRRGERLPVELSLFVATEFMTGLEYAHRRRADDGTPLGIIHRDISPQNVLISFEGEVKVTDFGIARVLSQEEEGFRLPGNLHGKFGYMSPEQANDRAIDQRSDVFSAGIVLWEMLVGARLFRGEDPHHTVELVGQKPIPPPSRLNPEVPEEVDRVCLGALERDRSKRYQTMGALLGELSRVTAGQRKRAGSRDLSVYMRRQFGTPGGGFFGPRASFRSEPDPSSDIAGVGESPGGGSEGGRTPIGQILIDQGSIDLGQLELALAEQRAQGGRIGELLVSNAAIDDVDLARALATQANLPAISTQDLESLEPPGELISRFPKDAAESSCVVPVAIDPELHAVRLAVCDPYDERAVLEAKVVLGVEDVALFVAPRSAIRETVAAWYGTTEALTVTAPLGELLPRPPPAGPTRVLLADADPEAAAALAERLEQEDCEVVVVHDGRAAREQIRTRTPVIALLDASLPRIDGYNLLLELRSADPGAAIFITSERAEEFRQAKALELGADDFLVKPFALELTASKVRRELQRRARARRPSSIASGPASGVSGSLENMSVVDIVQMLELARKTAHVVIQYEDGRQGFLRVDEGSIRGCSAPRMEGPEAFYHLVPPGPGLFRIEYRASPLAGNVGEDQNNTFLIVEAMRQQDERDEPQRDGAPDAERTRLDSPEAEPPDIVIEPPTEAVELAADLVLENPPVAAADPLGQWLGEQLGQRAGVSRSSSGKTHMARAPAGPKKDD